MLPPLEIQCVSALSKIASSESAERYSSEISGPSEHAQCQVVKSEPEADRGVRGVRGVSQLLK